MRKVVSSLLILTLIILFGATFYCSIKTEEVFKAQVEQLNQEYQGALQVELSGYQRGLLVSNVQLSLAVRGDQPLPLIQQIRHFPWGVTIYTRLAADSAVAQELADLLPLEDVQLVTDIDWTGAVQASFELPEVDASDESGQITIKGLALYCNFDQQLSRGDVSFQLANLEVRDEQQTDFQLSGVNFFSRFAEQQGLPLGDGEFTLARLSLKTADQPEVTLDDLRYQAATFLEEDKLSSNLELNLAGLVLLNEQFSNAELKLAISGIDSAAVRNIQETLIQLQGDLIGQQVDPMVLQFQMIGLYSQLFREGIDLNLERLALQTADGGLTGVGSLHLEQLNLAGSGSLGFDMLKANFQLDLDHATFAALFRLIDSLQRKDLATVNRAVLTEQAEQLAGAFVQKGLLSRRQDGGYRSELVVDEGKAELNGNPFKL